MSRSALVLPALAVACALAASSVVTGVAAGAATPHGRSAVNFHSTADHHVVAPATTRPGIAHLRNTGNGLVFVAEAKHGAGDAHQFAKDLGKKLPNQFLKDYRLVAVAAGKSGSYTELTRGTYYLADVDVMKVKAKRIETMTVTGPRVDARTPEGRGLVVTSHHDLRLPGSIDRTGYLHVQNRSSALASFLFLGVDDQTTRTMLADVVAHPSLKKIFSVAAFDGHAFSFAPYALAGPHSVSWVHYHGDSGRYLATVFTFGKHGETRLHHGQVRVLTLK